jgi:hypothetical protein
VHLVGFYYKNRLYSVFVLVNCDNVSFHSQKFYEFIVVVVAAAVILGGGGDGSKACHNAVYLHQAATVMTSSTQHK